MSKNDSKTTGIEPFIIECICMKLKIKESLSRLSEYGYDISAATFYRLKKEIEESSQQRLNLIASKEFLSQHLERIETLKAIHSELWNNYHIEKTPMNKSKILMHIADIQQYLSSYYDSTAYVMQRVVSMNKPQMRSNDNKEENNAQY